MGAREAAAAEERAAADTLAADRAAAERAAANGAELEEARAAAERRAVALVAGKAAEAAAWCAQQVGGTAAHACMSDGFMTAVHVYSVCG